MHKTVQRGIELGLVRYVDTNKGRCIEYVQVRKTYPIGKPEEWVRLLAYLHLAMVMGYPPEHIALEYAIKMGSSYRYADIVVFADADWRVPHLLVECKQEAIGERGFAEGIKQAESYARQINPRYVWVTSGTDGNNRYGIWQNGYLYALSYLPHFSAREIWWRELKRLVSTFLRRKML